MLSSLHAQTSWIFTGGVDDGLGNISVQTPENWTTTPGGVVGSLGNRPGSGDTVIFDGTANPSGSNTGLMSRVDGDNTGSEIDNLTIQLTGTGNYDAPNAGAQRFVDSDISLADESRFGGVNRLTFAGTATITASGTAADDTGQLYARRSLILGDSTTLTDVLTVNVNSGGEILSGESGIGALYIGAFVTGDTNRQRVIVNQNGGSVSSLRSGMVLGQRVEYNLDAGDIFVDNEQNTDGALRMAGGSVFNFDGGTITTVGPNNATANAFGSGLELGSVEGVGNGSASTFTQTNGVANWGQDIGLLTDVVVDSVVIASGSTYDMQGGTVNVDDRIALRDAGSRFTQSGGQVNIGTGSQNIADSAAELSLNIGAGTSYEMTGGTTTFTGFGGTSATGPNIVVDGTFQMNGGGIIETVASQNQLDLNFNTSGGGTMQFDGTSTATDVTTAGTLNLQSIDQQMVVTGDVTVNDLLIDGYTINGGLTFTEYSPGEFEAVVNLVEVSGTLSGTENFGLRNFDIELGGLTYAYLGDTIGGVAPTPTTETEYYFVEKRAQNIVLVVRGIPEPSSAMLVALGTLSFLRVRRRRNG